MAEQVPERAIVTVADDQVGKAKSSVSIVTLSSAHEVGLILPLVRAWHDESIYIHLPFSERKFFAAVAKTSQRGQAGASYYSLYKRKVVGLIDVAVGEAWLSQGGPRNMFGLAYKSRRKAVPTTGADCNEIIYST